MKAVLLGPPGSGKGTQAERLCRERGLLHLSTGDLLRAAVAQGTPAGLQAKGFIDRGELVPDAVVFELLKERLRSPQAARGYLLDGFPRNLAQARILEREMGAGAVDVVIHLVVDDEELVRRLLARGRRDDTDAVVRKRLEVYREETEPLVAHYRARGIVRTIQGTGTVEEVGERVARALDAPPAGTAPRAPRERAR